MASTRDKILAPKQRRREPADAGARAALGLAEGELFVAGATARDVDAWLAGRSKSKKDGRGKVSVEPDLDNTRAKLLIACLVDAEWRYVLRPSRPGEPGDEDALGELPNEIVTPLYGQALRLCGLADDEEQAELKNGRTTAAP